ncbi:glycosyltransferase, partial [Bacteroides cellulosilyticus]
KNINYVLTGQVSNAKILDFYRNNHVDLFINVSSSEGIPVSIMEAISFGIPVVATNVGGTNEIVVDGEDGFLLGKDFELKELSSLISYLIDNPIKLENLRHGARNLWSSLYSCSSNYLSFYNSILK